MNEEERRLYELGYSYLAPISVPTTGLLQPYTAQVTKPSWGIGLSGGTPVITFGTPKDLLTQEATGGITWPEKPTTYDYQDIVQDIVDEQKFAPEVPSPAEVDVAAQIDSFSKSIEQVEDMLPKAVPWLQCYVKLKLMTGLRQVDLLLLTVRNITSEGLLVTHHKTEDSSGKTTLYKWTPELRKVISQLKAIPPSSIHLFNTQQGKLYFVNGRYTTAFSSSWARWMKWFPKEIRFSERSLRNLVGSEGDLQEAAYRLGHADRSTTAKYYRLKPTVVTPLSSNNS